MRTVTSPEPGVFEVNWSWLPTFIGMNHKLQERIVAEVTPEILGKPIDDETLDLAHELVIAVIVKEFPRIEGLREYLDGLKFVRYLNDGEQTVG
jgi:hypothetical protein